MFEEFKEARVAGAEWYWGECSKKWLNQVELCRPLVRWRTMGLLSQKGEGHDPIFVWKHHFGCVLRIDYPGRLVLAVDMKYIRENICCNSSKKQRSEKWWICWGVVRFWMCFKGRETIFPEIVVVGFGKKGGFWSDQMKV